MSRCSIGNQRHWFTERGLPGVFTERCQRYKCNAINPRYKKQCEAADPQPRANQDPRLTEPTRNADKDPD